MKPLNVVLLASACTTAFVGPSIGQNAQALDASAVVKQVVTLPGDSAAAFSRLVTKTQQVAYPDGHIEHRVIGGYTELASGLHYQDQSGQWQDAGVEPSFMPDGSVAFVKLQTHYSFAVDANRETVLTSTKSDGRIVHSAVAGLAYYDTSSGQSAVFASPHSSTVQAFDEGVFYTNAFDGIDADILYRVHRWGMEQDVVIYGNVPPPEWFGMTRKDTKFCVLTEVVGLDAANIAAQQNDGSSAEEPKAGSVQLMVLKGGAWQKEEEFQTGYSWIDEGALDVGADSREAGDKTAVKSRMFISAGRTFLSEEIPFDTVEALGELSASAPPKQTSVATVPPKRPAIASRKELPPEGAKILSAYTPRLKPAMVMDYATYSSITNAVIFKKGQTYYISGFMILDTGAKLTVGPGAIVKFNPSASIKFINSAKLDCRGNVLDPAIFTTAHDTNVGEAITGFNGNLTVKTNWFNNAFEMTTSSNLIQGVDIRYSVVAVSYKNQDFKYQLLRDAIFRNCDLAIEINSGTSRVEVANVLVRKSNRGVYAFNYPTLVNDSTFEDVTNYACYSSAAYFSFTNNLFVGATNYTLLTGGANPTSGAANARWNSAGNWLGTSPIVLTSVLTARS